ncbi:MAG: TonB-dependent receptor plug domain-containing protein [Verrucomicrobiota bacterium]|nr:TonB-dependent receptor plug domain-containing protein [Verrucomicrobiota bacterium]
MKKLTTQALVWGACTLAVPFTLQADMASDDLAALSLEELMNIKIDISSNTEKTVREQPGIVSVITAREIKQQGSRDLIDLLQLVPGFQFGTDIGGVVGPVFRGLWAYEGKTQIILDGIEFNEGSFGTIQMNRHFQTEQIKQIEIIRGPGSALYGGTAELNVIRITTKGAEQNGGYGVGTWAFTDNAFSHQYSFGAGYTIAEDWRVSISGNFREDYLSNEDYVDLDGYRYSLAKDSALHPWSVNVGLGWKGLQTRFIYDFYDMDALHSVGAVASKRAYEFKTLGLLAQYEAEVTDWLTITPKFVYRDQSPWKRFRTNGVQEITATRMTYNITADAKINDRSSLMFGAEYYTDKGKAVQLNGSTAVNTYFNGARTVKFKDWALFAQYELETDFANVTLGGRYEDHSSLEKGSFVPRVGVTKAWDKFHTKLLYSQAFRTPNIRVVRDAYPPGKALEPEKTESYEVEVGYEFTPTLAVVGNVFYISVQNPYLFYDAQNGYLFEGEVSSYGFETELRHSASWGFVSLGYSIYLADKNTVPLFYSGDEQAFLGVPNQKLTSSVTVNVTKGLTLNLNGVLNSGAKGYAAGTTGITDYDPVFLFNSYLEYQVKGFSVGVGVSDLFDSGRTFIQPYNAGSGPLPDKSREVYLRLGYVF